mmetsp:Transcript_59834/g.71253  ORF Transcript_59834/g.71253 Transcript_59834/m.71253 type:complete len:440 (-) Transcript_59834:520-1839(-)
MLMKPTSVPDFDDIQSLKTHIESSCCNTINWRVPDLDESTSYPQSLETELKRLEVLRSYRVLDTERKASFERLTALAARFFDVPICLVSFVDANRQWFASNRGLGDVRETPKDVTFCAHTILSKLDLFIVPDATNDTRFAANGLVTGGPKIRFYAGAPLIVPEGFALGTLCIIDVKPRPGGLSLMEKQNLREIAGLVVDQIILHRKERIQLEKDKDRLIACTAHDLLTPLTSIQLNMGMLSEDKDFISVANKHHVEMNQSTRDCIDAMAEIFRNTVNEFRGERLNVCAQSQGDSTTSGTVVIANLLNKVKHVISTYPKKVPLTFQVDENVPPVINSDESSLFRCMINYLTNACKVTEFGSINLRMSMSTDESGKEVLFVECMDTGPGIKINHYSNLFRADGGFKINSESKFGGVGLGLNSVAQLISKLGGDVGYRANNG